MKLEPGGQRSFTDRHGTRGAEHLDPVLDQHHGEPFRHPRIVRRMEDDFRRAALPERDALAPEREIVAQDPLAVTRCREGRLQCCREVMQHTVAVAEQVPVGPPQLQRAGAGLLVRHPERAVSHRPHVDVAGIEEVVDVPVEIREAAFVEARRDRFPEHVHECDLAFPVPWVGGRGGGREEVGGVASHLM